MILSNVIKFEKRSTDRSHAGVFMLLPESTKVLIEWQR